jgi:hypothetical protein
LGKGLACAKDGAVDEIVGTWLGQTINPLARFNHLSQQFLLMQPER